MKNIRAELNKMLEEPFSYRDNKLVNSWIFFCKVLLCSRYIYMKTPFIVKLLLSIPIYFLDWHVSIPYYCFIFWSVLLDKKYRYDYSEETFTIRRYFKVYLFKNVLYLATFLFAYRYYFHPYGWYYSVYMVPMLLIATGYVLPIFDRRIYNNK